MAERVGLDPLWLSVGTLTALPVPAPRVVDSRTAGRAMLLAPVAALVPGPAAAVVAGSAAAAGLPGPAAAAAGLVVLALTTRGLHLDGLADTADGLAASYDRQRALDAMRRGDTGPAGSATLVLVLLLQTGLLGGLLARSAVTGGLALLAAVLVSRAVLPLACWRGVPAARAEGLGATVAGTVPAAPAAAVLGLVTVAAAAVLLPTDGPWWSSALAGPAAVAAAVLVTAVLVRRAVRRFGGITGDVLGAVVELGLAAALLGLSLALSLGRALG